MVLVSSTQCQYYLQVRDTYNATICHAICNYIAIPLNESLMKSHIPAQYKNGKEYINKSNMYNFYTWRTDVEIVAFAQMASHDVVIFTGKKFGLTIFTLQITQLHLHKVSI